jgi:hypothetical protein
MNTPVLDSSCLAGFKVVPKRNLREEFSPSQSAYYVLIGRRGPSDDPRESVLLVGYLEHFVDLCQHQIDALWQKHRVFITHVAVRAGTELHRTRRDLSAAYHRAVVIQELRQKLHPKFRRV